MAGRPGMVPRASEAAVGVGYFASFSISFSTMCEGTSS